MNSYNIGEKGSRYREIEEGYGVPFRVVFGWPDAKPLNPYGVRMIPLGRDLSDIDGSLMIGTWFICIMSSDRQHPVQLGEFYDPEQFASRYHMEVKHEYTG